MLKLLILSLIASLQLPFAFDVSTPVNYHEQYYKYQEIKVARQKEPIHYRDKVLVLMYHHVVEKSGPGISKNQLKEHLTALKENNYNVISMDDFVLFKEGKKKVPDNAILITFDDGYESFYTLAYPILKELDMIATKFIVVIDTEHQHTRSLLPHLTWDQMREMKNNGMSFYSHTYDSHYYTTTNSNKTQAPILSHKKYNMKSQKKESDEEYEERIKNDLKLANDRINEELKNNINILAFPYGSYNSKLLKIGKELNIKYFITTIEGINKSDDNNLVYRISADSLKTNNLLLKLKKYDK